MSMPVYRINHRHKSNRLALTIIIVLFLIAGGVGFYVYRRHQVSQQQAEQKARDESQTNNAKNNVTSNTSSGNAPSTSVKQDVPQSSASVTIDSVEQKDGSVTASATLSSQTGDCVFTYTIDGDKPVTKTSKASGGACVSSAPEVEFTRLGVWNLNVTAYVNGEKTEANQSVTIN